MNKARFFVLGTLFVMGMSLFAQSAEGDFETAADKVHDGLTITKYVGWDSTIVIPATIGGNSVTAIGKSAFAKQDDLKNVTIPDSVIDIGESAFETNKITSITFGKGIKTIGKRAFYDNNLSDITIPVGVAEIGERAFSHNLLAKITIPDNVIMGEYAFARNKQLTNLTFGTNCVFDKTTFIDEDNEPNSKDMYTNNIGERGKNLHYDYFCNSRKAGAYAIDMRYRAPKEVGEFKYFETRYGAVLIAYSGSSTSVRIPEKVGALAVKYVGTGTFDGKNVDRVLIPNGIVAIGDGAFYSSYYQGPKLTTVSIPDSVNYIGSQAFSGNKRTGNKLTSVTIGNGVTYIGPYAFSNNQLTSATIGNSVAYIGKRAFGGNIDFGLNQLTSITMPIDAVYFGDTFFGNNITNVVANGTVQKPVAEYKIGDRGPAGGLIFYDKGNAADGWRYLEAAPVLVEMQNIRWGRGTYYEDRVGTEMAVGTGKRNTELILAFLAEKGETGMAAQLCAELDIFGYDDWFLPSKDELDLMYKNLKMKEQGWFTDNGSGRYYWTSSESGDYYDRVCTQDFYGGKQGVEGKSDGHSVRAVRAF